MDREENNNIEENRNKFLYKFLSCMYVYVYAV